MKSFHFKYLFFIFYSGILCSQNWTPFNPNYRYNYKIDTANIVTNVIFHDSSKVFIGDTVFYLNRVGRMCAGSCPGFSIAFSPASPALVTNMPQFMQRYIHKLSNGDVTLSDPYGYVFKPNCALNQSWIFETTYSLSAACVSISSRNIFGINDSIKTIVTAGADTVELSKSFGILRFPMFNASHRYYKLIGIEASASYDSTALFGYKVPNAWNFYNYQVGDIFCEKYFDRSTPRMHSNCNNIQYGVLAKSVSATSITYTFDIYESKTAVWGTYENASCNSPFIRKTSVLTYSFLNSKSTIENLMYPGMMLSSSSGIPNIGFVGVNIVSFNNDAKGVFYKASGMRPNNFNSIFPQGNFRPFSLSYTLAPYYQGNLNQNWRSFLFSEILGQVDSYIEQFEYRMTFQKTCFTRNNINLLGNPYVGLNESDKNEGILFYPNPFNDKLKIEYNTKSSCIITISNIFGQEVFSEIFTNSNPTIELAYLNKGIYLLKIDSERGSFQKKIVKE